MIASAPPRCYALFPGAFRPPHAAHLAAVLDLAQRQVGQRPVDEVVVIIANRCRLLPGTTLALDAETVRRVWEVYLRGVPNARCEIASHSAIAHALAYCSRAAPGDQLLFCIGEADLERGDERFDELSTLAAQHGVRAAVIPAPTGSLPVRATQLRTLLAQGAAGRSEFLATLPAHLHEAARAAVWDICQQGARPISEIIAEKLPTLIDCAHWGITHFECLNPAEVDPVFRAHCLDGRTLLVKYAGDTVEAGVFGDPLTPKPRKRLAVERRALRFLHQHLAADPQMLAVDLPEVMYFDKETLTLLVSEVCAANESRQTQSLQTQLADGHFDETTAATLARFLAQCHQAESAPHFWGDEADDRRHWQRLLAQRTVRLAEASAGCLLGGQLAALQTASESASRRGLFHLDFGPQNVRVALCGDQGRIGVCNWESSSSFGDPACELGGLIGSYLRWGLVTDERASCGRAITAALAGYRHVSGAEWSTLAGRVVAFAGAALLASAPHDPQLIATATQLLAGGLAGDADADRLLRTALV